MTYSQLNINQKINQKGSLLNKDNLLGRMNRNGNEIVVRQLKSASESLDFEVCKQLLQDAVNKNESCVILCPLYSINIASKYEDGEELQWDLEELSDYLESFVSVSDYDDLIIDLSNEDN